MSGLIPWNRMTVTAYNPKPYKVLGYFDVENILLYRGIKNYQITDIVYNTMSKSDMQEFLEFSFAKQRTYIKEKFDCDDFSAVLRGQAKYVLSGFIFGEVHVFLKDGTKHALNCFIDRNNDFYYIEPQTNEIFSFYAGKRKGYKPYFVLI